MERIRVWKDTMKPEILGTLVYHFEKRFIFNSFKDDGNTGVSGGVEYKVGTDRGTTLSDSSKGK